MAESLSQSKRKAPATNFKSDQDSDVYDVANINNNDYFDQLEVRFGLPGEDGIQSAIGFGLVINKLTEELLERQEEKFFEELIGDAMGIDGEITILHQICRFLGLIQQQDGSVKVSRTEKPFNFPWIGFCKENTLYLSIFSGPPKTADDEHIFQACRNWLVEQPVGNVTPKKFCKSLNDVVLSRMLVTNNNDDIAGGFVKDKTAYCWNMVT
ncbi:hypothetical protein OnM2_107026 [Erysiphe neolycopersici]|uniref:Uncharacterized protein n=1 Tax=Erysiphe neolycopersici TaxID=212602 RepID=A0A420H724_9PEZI|nr:hypothetical protein OnM2_107026 [Erysiphe neolycopersici]